MPTKPAQFCAESSLQWLQMSERLTDVRQTEKPENDNDNRGRNRDEKREAASLFRTEKVEQSDDENCRGRELFRMRNAKILECRKCADRGRYQIIGDEEKRADDRNHFAAMANARIDAAAIGI